MKKRVLTWLMTAVMLVSLFPLPAFAAETEMYTGGLCPHHPQHTEECGYIEGVEGQPCGYVCQECFANEQRPEQTNLQWVQAMIGALPDAENITPDNRAGVEAQLDTIGATWAELSDEEAEQLDVVRCLAAQDALAALDGQENNGLPTALAAEDDVSYRYCDANGQNWQTGTKSSGDYTAVTADATAWTSGWYVASGTVSIGQRVTVTEDVHLILTDGCSLTVNGGINVNESNAITIYAQSTGENMGRLTATDSVACAGIGGNLGQKGGTITINGGFVTAIGGIDGAGIGGGQYSAGGIITINGGTVNATGGRYHNYGTGGGAGIGGGGGYGSGCFKGTVTITGGTVTAASSGGVAGIAGNPFSTGTDGNALIVASDISTENSNENEWGAVIFKGNEGKVYGSPTLKEDATIPSGKTLTIESGQTLTIGSGVTLTNNGAIKNNGTLTNNGTINGNGEYSGSGTVNKASPTAPNNGEGYTIDYTAETITANSGYEVSSDQSNTLEDDSTINPSGTLYVRKSGNNFCNASGWTSFTVANRPSAPTLSIDNDTESVTISSGYYYNTTGGDYANTWTQGIGSAVTVAPGASIYICIPATNSTFRSAVQTLEAPARASTPIGLQGVNTSFAGENDGEITGVSTAMEYKLSTADSWTVCPDTKITNLSAGKYQVRVKATTSTYASEATDVTIASGAEKTYTLNVTDITFDTATYGYTQPDAKAITITSIGNSAATIFSVTVSGSDFTISGSNKTVTAGGKLESYIVQPNVGLSAGTHTATITVTYDNNATAEATVSFTVNGAAQTAPAAPELDSKTYNSVTLKTVADNGNGAKAQYSSDNGTTWQASREFTGLSPSTKYSFVVRYGASGNYEASPVSSALEVTTEAAPVATYLVTVNGGTGGRSYAAGDTVTITATVPNGQRFTGWTVNTGGVTVPNTNPANFTMPTQAVTVTANFETIPTPPQPTTYRVTMQNDGNGTASASSTYATRGTKITLTATADSGYHFKEWQVVSGGVTVSNNSFTMPSSNVTVRAIFERDPLPVHTHAWAAAWSRNDAHHWHECTAQGCDISDDSQKDGYAAHTPGDWIIDQAATSTAAGSRHKECTVCGYVTQTGTIPATGGGSSSGGGGGGSYTTPTYKPDVTKPSGGGGTPATSPSSPKQGDTVTVTPKPDSGCEVGTITVTDHNGRPLEVTQKPDGTYTFQQPSGKVTIKVTYRPVQPVTTPWSNPFSDISESDWYYEAVKFVQERSLMNGYSNGRFGPNNTLSRAQLAQILFNKEGRPGVNYLMGFSDVPGEAWYTAAIRWAASQGIVGGYGNGTFGPNNPITREQLAVMLWRYSGSPAATSKELHFNDTDEISGFALGAMRWVVENGILNGYGDGRLGPQGQATRAQVAQMLKNFIENQEEENT